MTKQMAQQYLLFLVSTVAIFPCQDKEEDCGLWMRNMGGSCEGVDLEFMTKNCPATCGFCGAASKHEKMKGGEGEWAEHNAGSYSSCQDKEEDCALWMRNMGGSCEGVDLAFMSKNCPATCLFQTFF